MPPTSGHSTANHHAQRWIDSTVALNPMVQRQKSAARSAPVPRSTICSSSRSTPMRLQARIVAACIANSSAEPYRNAIDSMWNGL
jgi:hypothetical protein